MTRQRDIGRILAIAGASVAVLAIVAGFVIVGGPGNARDRRLDDLTSQRISQIVGVVQCAFDASGVAPIDYPTAAKTRSAINGPGQPPALCDSNGGLQPRLVAGETPISSGDLTYLETGPTQVKICGKFNTANDAASSQMGYPFSEVYPALRDPHPAGVHCYTLDLVKSNAAFDAP